MCKKPFIIDGRTHEQVAFETKAKANFWLILRSFKNSFI